MQARLLALVAAALCGASAAHAQPVFDAAGGARQLANGGRAASQGATLRGSEGFASRRRGAVTDGNGNLAAGSATGFSTANGGQGLRTRSVQRQSDGSIDAGLNASATGANGGTYNRTGNFTRDADGNATGSRTLSATNGDGKSIDASTSYTQGSGFERSATCHDAGGNTVSCGRQ